MAQGKGHLLIEASSGICTAGWPWATIDRLPPFLPTSLIAKF